MYSSDYIGFPKARWQLALVDKLNDAIKDDKTNKYGLKLHDLLARCLEEVNKETGYARNAWHGWIAEFYFVLKNFNIITATSTPGEDMQNKWDYKVRPDGISSSDEDLKVDVKCAIYKGADADGYPEMFPVMAVDRVGRDTNFEQGKDLDIFHAFQNIKKPGEFFIFECKQLYGTVRELGLEKRARKGATNSGYNIPSQHLMTQTW